MSYRRAAQELFSFSHAAKRPRLESFGKRRKHSLAPLPYPLGAGLHKFLTPETLKLLAVEYQEGLLTRLNDLVQGEPFEHASLVETIIATAGDRRKILAFNYASQALNNAFFLSRMKPKGVPMNNVGSFGREVFNQFGNWAGMQLSFSSAAMGMMGSGWLWLVSDSFGHMGMVGTYGPGTLLVQNQERRGEYADLLKEVGEAASGSPRPQESAAAAAPRSVNTEAEKLRLAESIRDIGNAINTRRSFSTSTARRAEITSTATPESIAYLDERSSLDVTKPAKRMDKRRDLYPLLCISVHEHAWLRDYGLWGKEAYVTNFWGCVDWTLVEQSYNKYYELRETYV